jgi:hypothetical protein
VCHIAGSVNRDRKIFEMIKSGQDIIIKIETCNSDIDLLLIEKKILQKELDDYSENKKLSETGFEKDKALSLIKEIDAIRIDYDAFRLLNKEIQEYNENESLVIQCGKEAKLRKLELPDECPLCGAIMTRNKE